MILSSKVIENLLVDFVTDFSISDVDGFNDFIKDFSITYDLPDNMSYLKRVERYDIKKFFPQAKSIVVCIFQYWNNNYEKNYNDFISEIKDPFKFLSKKYKLNKDILKIKSKLIARYSLFDDYHKVIKDRLKNVVDELKKIDKTIETKIFVDTSPVFEKLLAAYSGLGFIGRNTLLINPLYGSYLFIGGFFINKEIIGYQKKNLNYKKICDKCRLCEDKCPTKALYNNRLDPLKCVSYWTTHNKDREIPPEIIEKSKYFFGCDICQEVCPYNKNPVSKSPLFLLSQK
jgi:epoxyqueuosine reductase QueG